MVAKPPPAEDELSERIVDVDVTAEMESSFLEYAYSVIYSRALPDARDGLKPVQRRILYTMDQMRIRPDASHVKCARVVGQVMGQLHPHGDAAIYDALVRLGQPWSMREMRGLRSSLPSHFRQKPFRIGSYKLSTTRARLSIRHAMLGQIVVVVVSRLRGLRSAVTAHPRQCRQIHPSKISWVA